MEIVNTILEFVKVIISWPVALVVIFVILRAPISKLLLNLKSGRVKIGETEVSIENYKQIRDDAIADEGEAILSKKDVEGLLSSRIKYLDKSEVSRKIDDLYLLFRKQGITTKKQLEDALNHKNIAVLESLFVQLLNRNPEHPLDPTAVATYVPPLYLNKDFESTVSKIGSTIDASQEKKLIFIKDFQKEK